MVKVNGQFNGYMDIDVPNLEYLELYITIECSFNIRDNSSGIPRPGLTGQLPTDAWTTTGSSWASGQTLDTMQSACFCTVDSGQWTQSC